MSASGIIAKVALTAVLCALPIVTLVASGPPGHDSWWYPNPERRDYPIKLRLYAILDATFGPEDPPLQKWFAKTVATIVVAMICVAIWSNT
jgi:hypothetical protein